MRKYSSGVADAPILAVQHRTVARDQVGRNYAPARRGRFVKRPAEVSGGVGNGGTALL